MPVPDVDFNVDIKKVTLRNGNEISDSFIHAILCIFYFMNKRMS